jgi:hypothetical protein
MHSPNFLLPSSAQPPHLPKPLDFQEHLRRPLLSLERLLARIHTCHHKAELVEAFLTNVALLLSQIARIFRFQGTFAIVDHIDCADVELKAGTRHFPLFEFV